VLIEAKAAYVWDIKSNTVLYEKNSELQMPLASLTKIMTAIVAMEQGGERIVTLNSEDILAFGDSGLRTGEKFENKEIVKFMLTSSSNDAASAVATDYNKFGLGAVAGKNFIDVMNLKASELELNQTYFLNPSGLDLTATLSGGYGSVRDIAELLYYGVVHYGDIFSVTTKTSEKIFSLERSHIAENTNEIVETLPGILASKTGFTDMAQGNLAVIFNAALDRPVAVVVFGSSATGRFEDTKKLISAAVELISEESLK
jgi:D-alanyl-D-alanine carboxypeptidase (penicillin-binding protein 5/6)